MKKHYNSKFGTLVLSAMITMASSLSFAQCIINHTTNGTNVGTTQPFLWGQGFTATCSGDLDYVQITSDGTGTVSAGTLNIYSGNSVTGTPIYTQNHSAITVATAGDPIRVNLTGVLSLINGNQYTFEFTVDNVDVLADFGAGYTGGSAFQDGSEVASADFIFEVSIGSGAGIQTLISNDNIQLYPNPASNVISISGLTQERNYSIINTLGQEVKEGKISNDQKINIAELNRGVYFIKLDDSRTIKFIKD